MLIRPRLAGFRDVQCRHVRGRRRRRHPALLSGARRYHAGELSQTLGIHGLPQIDLWA
jgi:hypothetical protein